MRDLRRRCWLAWRAAVVWMLACCFKHASSHLDGIGAKAVGFGGKR